MRQRIREGALSAERAPVRPPAATQLVPLDGPEIRPPGRRAPAKGEAGLSFNRSGGPLVVVCGLHGGAGVSTLAYALAKRAEAESTGGVLLCETNGSRGDQGALVGVAPLFSLAALVPRAGRLRVASAYTADDPRPTRLRAASGDKALTVVDAGTARTPGIRELLSIATHVVWMTLARPGAAERARGVMAGLTPAARQALVVRGDRREGRELRQLAEQCCDRLIYMSDSPGTKGTTVDLADRRMLAALTALAGFLQSGVRS